MLPREFLKSIWSGGSEQNKKRNIFILLLFFLGIILMFGSNIFAPGEMYSLEDNVDTQDVDTQQIERAQLMDDLEKYELKLSDSLKNVLEHVEGISNVHVFIMVSEGKESVYARDFEEIEKKTLESDTEGGTREIYEKNIREEYVLLRKGGGDSPLLKKEKMPDVTGVLVVAEGLNNKYLRYEVTRTVHSVLEVPIHRIAVLPLGEGERNMD